MDYKDLGELLGSGNASEVYAVSDGRAVRIAKTPGRMAAFQRESVAIRAAAAAGYPVPTVHEVLEVRGRAAMILDRVDGPDALARLQGSPWDLPRLARLSGRLQAGLHRLSAPPGTPRLTDVIREHLRDAGVALEVARRTEARLAALPDGARLLHGDFHPGNVMLGAQGPVVIDWENATSGPPPADLAMTWILLRVAGDDPGSGPAERALMAGVRRLYARIHFRAARRVDPVPPGLVRAWVPVMAALRLGEGKPAERDALMGMIGTGTPHG